jgi:hypothetical protein
MIVLAAGPVARAVTYDSLVYPFTESGQVVTTPYYYNPGCFTGGQSVGWGQLSSPTRDHALLWTIGTGTAIDLNPTSMTNSVANGTDGTHQVGSVAGASTGGLNHAVIWSEVANTYADLNPTTLTGITNSSAIGVGGGQQIGNGGNTSGSNTHPILWSGNASSAIDLTPTNLGTTFVSMNGIATDGTNQVGAGNTTGPLSTNGWHALLWAGKANTAVDLTPTNFPTLVNSYAYGVSGNQQVGVGYPTQSGDPFVGPIYTAMLWTGRVGSVAQPHQSAQHRDGG